MSDARWCASRPKTSTVAFTDTSGDAQTDCIGGKECWILEGESPILCIDEERMRSEPTLVMDAPDWQARLLWCSQKDLC